MCFVPFPQCLLLYLIMSSCLFWRSLCKAVTGHTGQMKSSPLLSVEKKNRPQQIKYPLVVEFLIHHSFILSHGVYQSHRMELSGHQSAVRHFSLVRQNYRILSTCVGIITSLSCIRANLPQMATLFLCRLYWHTALPSFYKRTVTQFM